jgi:hypothetical protein
VKLVPDIAVGGDRGGGLDSDQFQGGLALANAIRVE